MAPGDLQRLFRRAVLFTALPPLAALPFWALGANVEEWSGSLGFYEVIGAPLLLALAGLTFYRRVRRFAPFQYLGVLVAAAAVNVLLWHLGWGLYAGWPDALRLELALITWGVQAAAALGAVGVVAGVQRVRKDEEA